MRHPAEYPLEDLAEAKSSHNNRVGGNSVSFGEQPRADMLAWLCSDMSDLRGHSLILQEPKHLRAILRGFRLIDSNDCDVLCRAEPRDGANDRLTRLGPRLPGN